MPHTFTLEDSRRGGRARARAFTAEYQSAAARQLRPDQRIRAAKAGARATIARHGLDRLRELARAKRLARPSCNEARLIALLAQLGLEAGRDYQREHEIRLADGTYYALDVAWPDQGRCLEILGEVHDADLVPFAHAIAAADAERYRRLTEAGWACSFLTWRDLQEPEIAARLAAFLGPPDGRSSDDESQL